MTKLSLVIETFPWFLPSVFFVFGAIIGSFLNVCILRLPKGMSVVSPASHCFSCGKKIAWFDNIPVLSWLILRGRARCCGAKFSPRYALIELLCAFLFLCMALLLPLPKALLGAVFVPIMIVCTFIDLDTLSLPDCVTVGGCVAGGLLSFAFPQVQDACAQNYPYFVGMLKGLLVSVTGATVGSGLLYWIRLIAEVVFKREAMGEGDVVLVGCIGAFCGWQGALFAVFGGSVIGTVILIPYLFVKALAAKFGVRNNAENLKPDSRKIPETANENPHGAESMPDVEDGMIPFGPWLCAGALVYFLFVSESINAYLACFTAKLFG